MYLRHFEKNVLYRKLRNTAASQTVCYAKLHLAVLKAHSALWALSRLFSMQLETTMEAEVTRQKPPALVGLRFYSQVAPLTPASPLIM